MGRFNSSLGIGRQGSRRNKGNDKNINDNTHTHTHTHTREVGGTTQRERERLNGITLQLDINPHSRYHRLKYLALGREDLFWNLWLVTLKHRCIDFETLQTILELDDKTLLLKILHTLILKHGELKLVLTWKLITYWIAFIVTFMLPKNQHNHLSNLAVNSIIRDNNYPGKIYPLVQ